MPIFITKKQAPAMKTKIKITALLFLVGFLNLSGLFAQNTTLVMPMGHAQKINEMQTSPDHAFLASVDSTDKIVVWDAQTGEELLHLKQTGKKFIEIAFHPTENIMASSTTDGDIFIWDVDKASINKSFSAQKPGSYLQYCYDGKYLLSGGKEQLKAYDTENYKPVKQIELTNPVTSMAAQPGKPHVAVGMKDGTLINFSLPKLEEVWSAKLENPVSAALWDQAGIYAGDAQGMLYGINPVTGAIALSEQVVKGSINELMTDTKNVILVTSDFDEYFKFVAKSNFKDSTPRKFEWASTPKDGLGLYSLAWADEAKSAFYIGDHDNTIHKWKMKEEAWADYRFKGFARPVYDIDVNLTEELLAIASRQKRLKIFDLTGAQDPIILEGHSGGIKSVDFHPVADRIVTTGEDGRLALWRPDQFEAFEDMKSLSSKVAFTTTKEFMHWSGFQELEKYNYGKSKSDKYKYQGSIFAVSDDGEITVVESANGITIRLPKPLKPVEVPIKEEIADFSISGKQTVVLTKDLKVYTIDNTEITRKFNISERCNRIHLLKDGSFLVWDDDEATDDYSAYYYNADGQKTSVLSGHQHVVNAALQVHEALLTASNDGTIKIWQRDGLGFSEAGTIILLRYEDYVVSTPSGLFDAAPTAMDKLHYVKKGKILQLSQLKDLYYEPDLLAKLVGFNSEPVREIQDLSNIKIYPEFDLLHPKNNNGKVGIRLKDNGGGIGRVVLFINDKEVSNDVRSANILESDLDINYDIKGHPYMKPGLNKITIKAYNSDGNLASKGKNIYVMQPEKEKADKPRLFSVIIGTADYQGKDLDLKFSAKDAHNFADAIRMSSTNMVGSENVFIEVFTTEKPDKAEQPTKKNIENAFNTFARKASANDYLVVYMAGHGVNFTDSNQNSDFYYLTSDAGSEDLQDQETREKAAISSTELTELFKKVPALKQVLIVDACHSGGIDLEKRAKKTMDSDEIRALEKMKDRTGLFILAGSAADAVSYETSIYGQGLLTYSLLFGMKGAALRDKEYVDVIDLFQFAAKKVPELAADIGGIQKPEIRVPVDAGSFDLGILKDEDKENIKIKSPKPVFVHTNFQEKSDFLDVIHLSDMIDSRLLKLSGQKEAPITFVDEKKFSGAYFITGRYDQDNDEIEVEIRVYKNDVLVESFKKKGGNARILTDKIMSELLSLLDNL